MVDVTLTAADITAAQHMLVKIQVIKAFRNKIYHIFLSCKVEKERLWQDNTQSKKCRRGTEWIYIYYHLFLGSCTSRVFQFDAALVFNSTAFIWQLQFSDYQSVSVCKMSYFVLYFVLYFTLIKIWLKHLWVPSSDEKLHQSIRQQIFESLNIK